MAGKAVKDFVPAGCLENALTRFVKTSILVILVKSIGICVGQARRLKKSLPHCNSGHHSWG